MPCDFKKDIMNAESITIDLAKDRGHSPQFDFVHYQFDKDTALSYTKNLQTNKDSLEIYVGKNYVVGSTKAARSYSYGDNSSTGYEIPKKWEKLFSELREYYNNLSFVLTEFKI